MTDLAEDVSDLRRWTFSGLVVITLYGGLAASLVAWREPEYLEPAEPSGAVVVDLAPVSAAPLTTPTDVAPGPEQTLAEARPEAKPDTPVPDDTPELPPAQNPDAAVDAPTKAQPEAVPEQQAAAATTAPAAVADRVAPVAAAPTQGRPDRKAEQAIVTWRSQILAAIERNKRYPEAARSRHEQGITQVRFMLDRKGLVSDAQVTQSSGSSALDGEAIALLQRAQPFPAPPDTFAGQSVAVKLPIRFTVK
ncbi:energy transducer TonB (plasmid) [Bradyrhizobium sp. ISRA443]|uniref:energy transducer TonB n=1 Tax=unclassified Bradyrhizobium TaxID=2631580 RepID=UPI00247A97B2|nr:MULTISPECIES: energy transducer TonB [unclassified Bradyrhizobium]WGR90701.1 energy transducer TonB [Bradyrhizobium sp. ISRA435]WGS03181.1 energy transducer TonB [Bradyrhizobium sp. ISRA436]WGS10025.1 energy transducer TonB [Bradyrhizobium sp. ISRA437]WGS16910.1 energy transducer TonB [Bradyrhizobium sp. ISRA443]